MLELGGGKEIPIDFFQNAGGVKAARSRNLHWKFYELFVDTFLPN